MDVRRLVVVAVVRHDPMVKAVAVRGDLMVEVVAVRNDLMAKVVFDRGVPMAKAAARRHDQRAKLDEILPLVAAATKLSWSRIS